MTNNISKQALAAAIAATLGMGTAFAQTAPVGNTSNAGYLVDSTNTVVKSGAGLCWRAGYWTPAMANMECDPDLVPKPVPVVAPQPAPAAAPTPAPAPKPAAEKVTLAADTLFDFDKATLRPEGKAKLDELVGQAANLKLEVIIAVGHTDRIGKDAYNQKLSERRAASVKEYLVGKGIEANRVYTEGKGKKQPVTGDKCKKMGKENRHNKKLVACLQPDRRVEIELIGTK